MIAASKSTLNKIRLLAARMYVGNPLQLTAYRALTASELRNPQLKDGKYYVELTRHKTAHSRGPGIVILSPREVELWTAALSKNSDACRLFRYDRTLSAYINWVSLKKPRIKVPRFLGS